MNDQLSGSEIDGIRVERQRLGGGKPDVDARKSLPGRLDERLRRIHGGHRIRPEPPDEFGGERPRPAPDVDGRRASPNRERLRELERERLRVATHEAGVGISPDVEAHILIILPTLFRGY